MEALQPRLNLISPTRAGLRSTSRLGQPAGCLAGKKPASAPVPSPVRRLANGEPGPLPHPPIRPRRSRRRQRVAVLGAGRCRPALGRWAGPPPRRIAEGRPLPPAPLSDGGKARSSISDKCRAALRRSPIAACPHQNGPARQKAASSMAAHHTPCPPGGGGARPYHYPAGGWLRLATHRPFNRAGGDLQPSSRRGGARCCSSPLPNSLRDPASSRCPSRRPVPRRRQNDAAGGPLSPSSSFFSFFFFSLRSAWSVRLAAGASARVSLPSPAPPVVAAAPPAVLFFFFAGPRAALPLFSPPATVDDPSSASVDWSRQATVEGRAGRLQPRFPPVLAPLGIRATRP